MGTTRVSPCYSHAQSLNVCSVTGFLQCNLKLLMVQTSSRIEQYKRLSTKWPSVSVARPDKWGRWASSWTVTHTCNPIPPLERLKQEYLEFHLGYPTEWELVTNNPPKKKKKVKLWTWKDYICNPVPLGRQKQEDGEFEVSLGYKFKKKKKKMPEAGLCCCFWGNRVLPTLIILQRNCRLRRWKKVKHLAGGKNNEGEKETG